MLTYNALFGYHLSFGLIVRGVTSNEHLNKHYYPTQKMNNPQQIVPLGASCNIFWASRFLPATRFKPNFKTSKRWNLLIESAFVDTRNQYVGKRFCCTPQDVNIIFTFEKLKTHFIPYLTGRQNYIINEFLINTEDRVGHLLTCNCYNLTGLYTFNCTK